MGQSLAHSHFYPHLWAIWSHQFALFSEQISLTQKNDGGFLQFAPLHCTFLSRKQLKVFLSVVFKWKDQSQLSSFLRATSPEQFSDTGHQHRLGNNVRNHGNWKVFHLVNKLQDVDSLQPTKDALFGRRLIYFATHVVCE